MTARYTKTEKGHAEIAQRQRNLRGKLRTLLFLVDPGKSLEEIMLQAAQIGAPDDALAQLIDEGYIVEVGTAAPTSAAAAVGTPGELGRFQAAKTFMNDTIVDALGVRAFFFTLKLERCATRADLTALLEDYAAALSKKLDRADVEVLAQRTRDLLTAA